MIPIILKTLPRFDHVVLPKEARFCGYTQEGDAVWYRFHTEKEGFFEAKEYEFEE